MPCDAEGGGGPGEGGSDSEKQKGYYSICNVQVPANMRKWAIDNRSASDLAASTDN